MKLQISKSAGIVSVLSAFAIVPAFVAHGQTNLQLNASTDTRYGFFNLLDHRSSYGTGVFPEPFLVDDSDLEVNEARLDWNHSKGPGTTSDEITAEIEKGFGVATFEVGLHYERSVEGGQVTDGIGNVDLGARCPLYQYVSANEFVDSTFGAAIEVGIPVHSSVSKNTELVPKIFNDFRAGNFTLQGIAGYSTLFGPGEEGGSQAIEYGFDFGYSIQHERLPIPHVRQVVPMFELTGETGMNNGASGVTSLIGLAGFRVNTDAIGRVQPRLGLGFFFPLNGTARNDTHWGIATSFAFEY